MGGDCKRNETNTLTTTDDKKTKRRRTTTTLIMTTATTTIIIRIIKRIVPSFGILPLLLLLLLNTVKGNDDEVISNFATHKSIYDENGKLSSHLLVYPFGEGTNNNCLEWDLGFVLPGYNFKHMSVTGDALETVFPNYKPNGESGCLVACLEVGTDRSVVGHTMPHQHYDPHRYFTTTTTKTTKTTKYSSFDTWFNANCNHVQACITNYYNRETPLTVHWIRPETQQLEEQAKVPYGLDQNVCFNTDLGHTFHVTDDVDGSTIGIFTVGYRLFLAFGTSPPSGNMELHPDLDGEIERTLQYEWNNHKIPERSFSPLGFAKGRLPKDVFASMGAFYYNNRHNKVREEWDGNGVYVNWWETDVYFIQVSWELRQLWQQRLRDMVAEWAGVPVEQTIMYGMRQYEHGARLLTHVDQIATHALSLIVNVAQGNMTEPWPVEVFDHADRLHEVLMEPGDVLFYESAKNLHSRNRPLKGDYYVNIFAHYRPEGDGDTWHRKKLGHQPPGVPPPVLETEGECRLKNVEMTRTASGQLGVVQQVDCDDPRLGNSISPTFFQAKTSDDLLEWYHRAGSGHVKPPPVEVEHLKAPRADKENSRKGRTLED